MVKIISANHQHADIVFMSKENHWCLRGTGKQGIGLKLVIKLINIVYLLSLNIDSGLIFHHRAAQT